MKSTDITMSAETFSALRAQVADLTATNEMLHQVYDAEQAERRRLREALERIAHWKSEWWDAEDCNAMQTVAREALR